MVGQGIFGFASLLLVSVLAPGCVVQQRLESGGPLARRGLLSGGGQLGSGVPMASTGPLNPEQRFSPTSFEQSFTNKDTSIREDPNLLKAGVSRAQIRAAFGEPNATRTQNGLTEDVYAFYPDGAKYVNPQVRARNVAAAFFTMGTSSLIRAARTAHTQKTLTVYHLIYGADGNAQAVEKTAHDESEVTGSEAGQQSKPTARGARQ